MRLIINIALSLGMLAACVWLVWPDDPSKIEGAFSRVTAAQFLPYLAIYLGLFAINHFCRAWRWNNLLAPLGTQLSPGRLMAVNSVGFMAILALPARLGEFVRPMLIREQGKLSGTAALGTVAVERVIDGLIVSLYVFGACFALRGPDAPAWMMPTAYTALLVFAAATVFLGLALWNRERAVNVFLRMSLLPWIAPKVAHWIRGRMLALIEGFLIFKDKRNLLVFTLWSLAYWTANGLSVWVLARGFGLDLSVVAGFAVMGIVAVGITLPNSPGLIGQFQAFTVLGLSLYLPQEVAETDGLAFAIVLHALQVVWYLGTGALALSTKYVSFSDLLPSRKAPSP